MKKTFLTLSAIAIALTSSLSLHAANLTIREQTKCFVSKSCDSAVVRIDEQAIASMVILNISGGNDKLINALNEVNYGINAVEKSDLNETNILRLERALNAQIDIHNKNVASLKKTAVIRGAILGGAVGTLASVKAGLFARADVSGNFPGIGLMLGLLSKGSGVAIVAAGAGVGAGAGLAIGTVYEDIDETVELLK